MIAAGLLVATLLIFARAIGNGFVNYDDPDYVTANAQVQGGITVAGIRWALTSGVASNWHPLTWMSHQLDVTLFGLDPRGHHATSVLWHALNAALAFLALRRLTGSVWRSAFCAALFAWHPLRVESVAWVSERKDVLSGFFFFAVLWLYAGYVRRRRDGLPWLAAYVATLAAFALGLMAKPMLVTLPCLLLLLDFWPLRRVELARGAGSTWARLVLEKLPFFVFVIASAAVTYHVQKAGGSVTAQLSLGDRLGNAVIAVVRYLGTFLLPVDLAVLYPHPGSWPARKVVAALLVVGGLTAAAVWQLRRRPWIAVGWFWFLGTLVPVIGLVQVGLQSMADRYTYLTIIGVQVAAGWSLATAATAASRRISGGRRCGADRVRGAHVASDRGVARLGDFVHPRHRGHRGQLPRPRQPRPAPLQGGSGGRGFRGLPRFAGDPGRLHERQQQPRARPHRAGASRGSGAAFPARVGSATGQSRGDQQPRECAFRPESTR